MWLYVPSESSDLLPMWPPGPADIDAWAAILKREPSLEPAIRKLVDEFPDWLDFALTNRVDQLAALGNAVVPAVAAKAWKYLMEEMNHAPHQ